MGWKRRKVNVPKRENGSEEEVYEVQDFPGVKSPSERGSAITVNLEKKITSLDSSLQEIILQGRSELKALREENKALKQVYIKKPPSPLREYEDPTYMPSTYEELKSFPLRHKNYHERYFAAESSTNFAIRLELWAFLTLLMDLSESGKGPLENDPVWYYNYAIKGIKERILDFSEEADNEGKPIAIWVNENIFFDDASKK